MQAAPITNHQPFIARSQFPIPPDHALQENPVIDNMPLSSNIPATSQLNATSCDTVIDSSQHTMVYLDGEKLYYEARKVGSKHLCHFAKDIERIFLEWENSRIMTVNSRGIPLKHWPLFYQKKVKAQTNGQDVTWDAIKVMWGNWKVP